MPSTLTYLYHAKSIGVFVGLDFCTRLESAATPKGRKLTVPFRLGSIPSETFFHGSDSMSIQVRVPFRFPSGSGSSNSGSWPVPVPGRFRFQVGSGSCPVPVPTRFNTFVFCTFFILFV